MRNRLLWGLILAMGLFVACGKQEEQQACDRSTLRLNLVSPPLTFDPRKGCDVISSNMHFMLFEGLTKDTPESDHAPGVAKSYEVSQDGTRYTFHLRDSTWSNGDPVTARDFAESWKAMLDPAFPSPNANLLYCIKNAEARKRGDVAADAVGISCPDNKTLVVELERPAPCFLKLTSFCALAPTNQRILKDHPNWADKGSPHFVCNGPFQLKKYATDSEIVLEKNPSYWNADKVQLCKIHISLVTNSSTAYNMYEQGQLDLLGAPFADIPRDSIPHLKKRGDLKIVPIAGTQSFYFNTTRFPFTNKNIRKAFGLAINRRALVNHLSQLGDTIGVDNMPPVVKHNKVLGFIKDNDTATARACFEEGLREIGIKKEEFPAVTLIYGSNSDLKIKIAQVLQESWMTKLGVKVNLKAIDFKVFLDMLLKKNYEIATGGWIFQYNDVMNGLERYKYKNDRKNHPGWENADYVRLLNESMYAKSEGERYTILEKAEGILLEEMPTVALYHMNNAMLQNPKLEGVYISPTGLVHLDNAYFK